MKSAVFIFLPELHDEVVGYVSDTVDDCSGDDEAWNGDDEGFEERHAPTREEVHGLSQIPEETDEEDAGGDDGDETATEADDDH